MTDQAERLRYLREYVDQLIDTGAETYKSRTLMRISALVADVEAALAAPTGSTPQVSAEVESSARTGMKSVKSDIATEPLPDQQGGCHEN